MWVIPNLKFVFTLPVRVKSFFIFRQPRPQRIFSLYEEGEKEALEHFTHVIKIWSNRGNIFKNKSRKTWAAIMKTSHFCCYIFLYSVWRARDKKQTKNIQARRKRTEVSYLVCNVLTKIWKNKIYKVGNVDDRIQVLQLARSTNKRQKETKIWIEKDGFNPAKLKIRLIRID